MLELDFEPFNATFPRPTRSSSIGNGVQFLNRHLSSFMFRNEESLDPLLAFLRSHRYDGHVSLCSIWMNAVFNHLQTLIFISSNFARCTEILNYPCSFVFDVEDLFSFIIAHESCQCCFASTRWIRLLYKKKKHFSDKYVS